MHRTTERLVSGIGAIPGLAVLSDPDACVVAFTARGFDIYKVADAMQEAGWSLPRLQHPPALHVCVSVRMAPLVERFLGDLRRAAEVCRDTPEQLQGGMAGIYGSAAAIPDRSMVGDLLAAYLDTLYKVKRG